MDRKPLAFAESRDAKSIRYSPSEWAVFVEQARVRDTDPSTLARECSLIGINVLSTPALMEAFVRHSVGARAVIDATRVSHASGKGA